MQRKIETSKVQQLTAEFIVVGGGSAGCIVAARLAEYGFETLLISSGSNDTLNPLMRQKSRYDELYRSTYFKHHLPTEPSSQPQQRIHDVIAWNTLGGSSVNNGGMQRIMQNDWKWFLEATGDSSFHWDRMSKYYKMVENFTSDAPSAQKRNRGTSGPIKIKQDYDRIFDTAWRNVAKELNETFSDDLAGQIDHGFSFEPSAFTNGLRSWSGDAYLTTIVSKYPNLKVLTDATATQFEMDDRTKCINSVLFVASNGLFRAVARKEYILSAGVFKSPHLLMLSGIGDPEVLKKHKIPVKHSLERVGKNLIDNGAVFLEYSAKNFSTGDSIPVALINSQSKTTGTNPNTFFILDMDQKAQLLSVVIFNGVPKSLPDSVSLHSSNPLRPPKINLDYLKDERDVNQFTMAVDYVRRVLATNTIKKYATLTETLPGMNQKNLSQFVRDTIEPAHHFSGTCSMGRSAHDSVVDSQFKVHGINNLRVVDASVFPAGFVTKAGPCLTIYALAEKTAHLLKQQYLEVEV